LAKEFLSQRGVAFKEYDVAADSQAAYRMIRLSGQRGVPVITVGDDVVIGFDRPRLEQLLSQRPAGRPRLGASVADAARRLQHSGAYVGRVQANSPAARAGLRAGDVIVELDGQPIDGAAALERGVKQLSLETPVPFVYVRRGQRLMGQLSFDSERSE
jgi:glutaredoxin 3